LRREHRCGSASSMPTLVDGDTTLYYEEHGTGYPVLLLAPGGMRSSIAWWERAPFHPVRELSTQYRVIAMDQRNAGRSRAPVTATDGWHTYVADHVSLLDHLGIQRCHVLGACIGAAFALRLIATAPARVSAAVLLQPIGLSNDNRAAFHAIFDSWGEELTSSRPELTTDAIAGLRANLYDGEFVFSVSRADVRRCPAPLLVLRGSDIYHPAEISEEVARLAPRAEFVTTWKEGPAVAAAVVRVREFLAANSPPDTAGK
jgi:pimeloyl-ACP methyl ester carboxylesterase